MDNDEKQRREQERARERAEYERRREIVRQPLERLMAKYPAILPSELRRDSHVAPGWEALVDKLLGDITALPGATDRVRVEQIKQKFAELRVYLAVDGHKDLFIDLIGSDGGRATARTPASGELRQHCRQLVDAASEASTHSCEACGEPGVLRKDRPFIHTLCDKHVSWHGA